jgi:hypothetical protein
MAKHPPVSTAKWFNLYEDERASIHVDANNNIFYKVILDNKTKYFYNETAHHDVPRYLVDATRDSRYWGALLNG